MMFRAVGLFVLLACSVVAYAAPSEEDRAGYMRAGERFAALMAEAETAGSIDKLKTDEFRDLVRTLSDEERMIGSEPLAFQDLQSTMEICEVTNRSLTSILTFGMKTKVDITQETPLSPAEAVKAEANVIALQHETTDLLAFLLRCLVRPISAVTEATAGFAPEDFNDEAREGLALMRSGVVDVVTGACEAATDTRFDQDVRGALLAVVAETAEVYASVTRPKTRQKIAKQIEAAEVDAPEKFRGHLSAILTAFRSERCAGLCRIE